jgi:HD superfamily phosphohydrolase
MFALEKKDIIRDPIHRYIEITSFEKEVINSPWIQRLRYIKQTPSASYVYPGSIHTRFEHSLGVAALAQKLMENLRNIHGVNLNDDDIHACVIAALCHDIGHGPFSHNFESILITHLKKDHEDFTQWLINESELGDIISDLGFNKHYISMLAVGRGYNDNLRTSFLISQVISSGINVDSMDYLLRDNYHTGTKGNSIDINRLLIAIDEIEGGILGVDIRALIALEGFLLARISSFRTIYFHKTCRAVQLMTSTAIEKIIDSSKILDYATPNDFTYWDDYLLWAELVKNEKSRPIMEKLKRRQLIKLCYESKIIPESNLTPELKKINNTEIIEKLTAYSGVPVTDIFIDTPSSPNVPYGHISETTSNEIYTFVKTQDNCKEKVNLEDYSVFFNLFKGSLNLFRIYTWPQYRKQVMEAANKLLKNNIIM